MKSFLLVAGIGLLCAVFGPASGTTYLVWTNGTPAAPYDTWPTAFTNIQNAVDYATDGDVVLATNGTYNITTNITITKGITVQSVNGAGGTIVNRSGASKYRIFYLGHSNAVVDGFTITNGHPTDFGGGVYITNGTVKNCTISGNTVDAQQAGGGVCCWYGGLVSNCTISGNTGASYGAGVYCFISGLAVNCVISGNSGVGGFCSRGRTLRNCVIRGNTSATGGGGVHLSSGGEVQNCTIVSNTTAVPSGGGVNWAAGGSVVNSIIYFNTTNNYNSASPFTYSCTTPSVAGTGNITNDPGFVDFNQRNYHLARGSPCINTGTNQAWMIGATDLDGNPRRIGSRVDLGAYEYVPPKGAIISAW